MQMTKPHALRLLTVRDIATAAQVSVRTVRRWIDTGALPTIRLGRCLRIHPEAFAEFIDKNKR